MVFGIYYRCSQGMEAQADQAVQNEIGPVIQGYVDSGALSGWSWLTHVQGGAWRRALITIGNDQHAAISSEFLPDKLFHGWVKRISPVVDPRSGTFKVTVGLRDRFEYLRPGLFVNVQIITDTHEKAVLIPKQAVVYDGGDKFVFTVDDTAAVRIKLQPGFEDADFIEALADIAVDTPIIVVGQNGLKDQARVRVVNQEPSL